MSRDFLKEIVKPQFPNIDIVAIHGLNAWKNPNPAEHTWTAEGKLWLRDYLPQTAPNARVLLAGYNSNAALGTTTLDIRGQANNLLNRLDAMRKEDPDRPLIFICHSMGGLVVKQAIITASSDNNYKKIVSSTYGIVFFGTPHNGGNHAGIGSVAAKIARAVLGNPNSGFMEVLQSRSYALDNITESFRPFLEDFQFISFYETKNFRHTRDVSLYRYHTLNPLELTHLLTLTQLIVPKKSAVLGLAPEREKQIGLAADHSGICKFSSPSDPMYQQVSDNITTMIDEAI
ncbi:hypothetical protein B0T17DRAFT_307871 [Bombardia bombarda]|uniref:DUF676 domain-containing protein n=1 Tax=Bombardia bombarda TaxID=252184 RepID=A0AA40C1X4_9PEZI|nr:hypothetical protein B0T17DRAFT_307871 [Bombardia bombarda]